MYLAELAQQNTPTESIGTSPAQRLLADDVRHNSRQLKNSWSHMRSVETETVKTKILAQQERKAKYYNKRARDLSPLEEERSCGTEIGNGDQTPG